MFKVEKKVNNKPKLPSIVREGCGKKENEAEKGDSAGSWNLDHSYQRRRTVSCSGLCEYEKVAEMKRMFAKLEIIGPLFINPTNPNIN